MAAEKVAVALTLLESLELTDLLEKVDSRRKFKAWF